MNRKEKIRLQCASAESFILRCKSVDASSNDCSGRYVIRSLLSRCNSTCNPSASSHCAAGRLEKLSTCSKGGSASCDLTHPSSLLHLSLCSPLRRSPPGSEEWLAFFTVAFGSLLHAAQVARTFLTMRLPLEYQ